MKRKLVRQGTSTLMVSLPSKWIKQNSLEKGSEVEIEEKENQIIIAHTRLTESKRKIHINLTGSTETAIRTLITNTYRLGYDIVEVDYKDDTQYKILSSTVKDFLLGFEIVSTTGTGCVIENITEPNAEHAESIFLKLLYNITELLKATRDMLEGKNEHAYVEELEKNIQRYDNFCRRIASQDVRIPATIAWSFYAQLVHGQREIFLMGKYVLSSKIKVSTKTIEYYKDLQNMFAIIREAYTKNNDALLEQVHQLEKNLIYKKRIRPA